MRVLFSCRPAYGHVNPLLPLATASRDTGHQVLFATGERPQPRLRELGFRAERVGISIDEADQIALRDDPGLGELPREERWRFGVVVFGDVLARRTLEDLRPLLDEAEPDLLVYGETDVGAAAAAHSVGVPAVAHSLGRQVPDPIRRAVLERLAEVARCHGLGALPGDLFEAGSYLDICPPSLRTPPPPTPGSGSRSARLRRSGRRTWCRAGSPAFALVLWCTSRSGPMSRGRWARSAPPQRVWARWMSTPW